MLEDTLIKEDIYPQYVSCGETHVGKLRPSNQDAFAALDGAGLWVVADGMGGYRDGDIASRMVCEAFAQFEQAPNFDDTIASVRKRLSEVNRRLFKASIRRIDPIVSGTTVAILAVQRTACAMIWAGDSRIYRLRHGQLTQLTTDHTWAAELNLQTTGEEADHAITRAVGGEGRLAVDVRLDRVQLGDRYLLCSDGLTHELGDDRIAALLEQGYIQDCAKSLIAATLQAGARDNVTVLVVDAR